MVSTAIAAQQPQPWGQQRRRVRQCHWQPIVLDNDRLDLAVARGAAYYGMVRRGQACGSPPAWPGRITSASNRRPSRACTPRTAVRGRCSPLPSPLSPSPLAAVCLLPAGIEPGHDVELAQRQFDLLVSEPAEFPLFVSSTRLTDKPGELVPIDRERMTPLPPMRTVLRTRKKDSRPKRSPSLCTPG